MRFQKLDPEFKLNHKLTQAELQRLWQDFEYLEEAVNEAIPPHSGYRKGCKRRLREIQFTIQRMVACINKGEEE